MKKHLYYFVFLLLLFIISCNNNKKSIIVSKDKITIKENKIISKKIVNKKDKIVKQVVKKINNKNGKNKIINKKNKSIQKRDILETDKKLIKNIINNKENIKNVQKILTLDRKYSKKYKDILNDKQLYDDTFEKIMILLYFQKDDQIIKELEKLEKLMKDEANTAVIKKIIADKLLENGKEKLAIKYYESILNNRNISLETRRVINLQLAKLYYINKDYEKSEIHYINLLKITKDLKYLRLIRLELIKIYFSNKKYQKAYELILKSETPKYHLYNLKILVYKSFILLKLKKYEEAFKVISYLLNEKDVNIYQRIALINQIGQLNNIEELEKIIKLLNRLYNSNSNITLKNLINLTIGKIYIKKRDYNSFFKFYKQNINNRLNKQNIKTIFKKMAYEEKDLQNRVNALIAYLNFDILKQSEKEKIYIDIVLLYIKLNKKERALLYLKKLSETVKNITLKGQILYWIGNIYEELNMPHEAFDVFTRCKKIANYDRLRKLAEKKALKFEKILYPEHFKKVDKSDIFNDIEAILTDSSDSIINQTKEISDFFKVIKEGFDDFSNLENNIYSIPNYSDNNTFNVYKPIKHKEIKLTQKDKLIKDIKRLELEYRNICRISDKSTNFSYDDLDRFNIKQLKIIYRLLLNKKINLVKIINESNNKKLDIKKIPNLKKKYDDTMKSIMKIPLNGKNYINQER